MNTAVRYRALLGRWVRAFRPERIWVNGERLWECQACGMASHGGWRNILHSPDCLWVGTSEVLEAEGKEGKC